jgi:hypothetical protein
MDETIRARLAQIDELFPPERLAKSRERWTRLWRGEAPLDRHPFLYFPYALPYYDAGFTPEERLQANLDEFIVRGHVQDDFIPAFFPGCRQSTIPNMFGAQEVIVDRDYTCRRIIARGDDVDRLPPPSLAPGTVAHEWLEMQRYVLEATEGRLPIHVTDMQGPPDVCGQLWGYDEFLASAYEAPERYHALMDRVTHAFILFWDAQRSLLEEAFVGTHLWGWNWVPPDAGASLSADSLVMISPTFYSEFFQPYLQRIGERFGGLAVHSCGHFPAVIPPLCATPTVKAVNAGEMSLPELHAAGVRSQTLIIAGADADTIEETFSLIRSCNLRVDMSIRGLWPDAPFAEWTAEHWQGIRRIEERVLTAAEGGAATGREPT